MISILFGIILGLATQKEHATVIVENDAHVSVTVYAVDRGAKIRLGNVSATSRQVFTVRASNSGMSFALSSRQPGGVITNEIQNVRPGDILTVLIPTDVTRSYATRSNAGQRPYPILSIFPFTLP